MNTRFYSNLQRTNFKDTMHLLTMLRDITLPENTILFTLDIDVLYFWISHERGLQVVEKVLCSKARNKHSDFIVRLLKFLLPHNKSQFDCKFFCQAHSTAMGTKCAPAYANSYLGDWETWLFAGGGVIGVHRC